MLIELPPTTEWPVCSGCECGCDARLIHRYSDRIVAACPLDARCDTILSEPDLRSFHLDLAAMLQAIVDDSDWAGPVSLIMPELWLLTQSGPAPTHALFFARTMPATADAVITIIRERAGANAAIVLGPELPSPELEVRFKHAGVHLLAATECLANTQPARPFRIEPEKLKASGGLTDSEVRLRIHTAARRACLDGIDLHLTPRSFDLLRLLAEAAVQGDAPVKLADLMKRLVSGNADKRTVIRSVHKLRQEAIASGIDRQMVQALVENLRARGYRLMMPWSEIVILD